MSPRTSVVRLSLAVLVALLTSGAGLACAIVNPIAPSNGSPEIVTEQIFCVDETNRLRATVGLPPLQRAADIEEFSTEAARVDGAAHVAHTHFTATNGGGVSHAQNEIPWWNFVYYRSVHAIVRQGIALEWAEGAGGGHYANLTGNFTEAGCGIWIANGEVTVAQDYR